MAAKSELAGDDDGIDARLLGVDLRLAGVLADPGAEGVRAGVVDDLHCWVADEVLGDRRLRHIGREEHDVARQALLGKEVAQHRDGQRQRQGGARVRLHDDGVAGGEAGEEAGIAVPGREGLAADDERDAAGDNAPVLLDDEGRGLALRLLPDGAGGGARHLGPGGGDGLEPAVLGVRAAGLEGHGEGLAGGVHHRVADLEANGVEPRQGFEEKADAGFGRGGGPLGAGRFGGGDEHVGVRSGIGNPELRPPGRELGPDAA